MPIPSRYADGKPLDNIERRLAIDYLKSVTGTKDDAYDFGYADGLRDARADAQPAPASDPAPDAERGPVCADCDGKHAQPTDCPKHRAPAPDAGRPLGHADADDDGWTTHVYECRGSNDENVCADGSYPGVYHIHARRGRGGAQFAVFVACSGDEACYVTGHDHAGANGGE